MLRSYADIKSRIADPPLWWDEQGVPRYEPFSPDLLGVYDDLVSFQLIACQDCGRRFKVAHSSELTRRSMWFGVAKANETKPIDIARAHYGDPPIHGCVGDTMNVDLVKVLGVWKKDRHLAWRRQRRAEKEVNAELDASDGD